MNQLIAGAVAGLTATAPMTALMQSLHRQLPPTQRYPLPPRQITMSVARTAGLEQKMDETEKTAATYSAHFSYGAAAGATFGALSPWIPGRPVTQGVVFGLAVWTVSYLGWLPATGILRSATKEPAPRNGLMIAAHIAWGAATGALVGWSRRL